MPDELSVYLDHHIKRENLRYKRPVQEITLGDESQQPTLRLIDLIRTDIHYIFTKYLRKPDFQRATWSWTPEDCVSLLESVTNYQVVPSVILWKSPDNDLYYILDGGHRISVVLAWMKDDWGESQLENIEDPQQKTEIRASASRVRQLVQMRIGAYKDFEAAEAEMKHLLENDVEGIRSQMGEVKFARAKFCSSLLKGDISFDILWVKGDYQIAEKSFLKINKSGQKLSDWETTLVENRNSSFARAVMSIASSDTAPHYWPLQAPEGNDQEMYEKFIATIVDNVKYIQSVLFHPPHNRPIKSLAQPFFVATTEKKPYYVAELLTYFESFRGQPSDTDKLLKQNANASPKEIIDSGYELTNNAVELLENLIGDSPKSLEIIPLLYFYKSDGTYIRSLFYGLIFWLLKGNDKEIRLRKEGFSAYRGAFEFLLRKDKDTIVQAMARNKGSGTEVTLQTAKYYDSLLDIIIHHVGNIETDNFIADYTHIISEILGTTTKVKSIDSVKSRLFSQNQKSSAIVDILLDSLITCEICGGKLNPEGNVQHDHIIRARDGGKTSRHNQRVTHPFCNNRRDQIERFRENGSGSKLPPFIFTSNEQPSQLKLFDDSFFK